MSKNIPVFFDIIVDAFFKSFEVLLIYLFFFLGIIDVNTGDLIITIAGTIGLVAPVGASFNGANLTENAAKLIPRYNDKYDVVFFSELMQTKYVQDQIGLRTGQVTIGKLALFRIEQITFPIPPLSLQKEFAQLVAEIRELELAQAASRKRLDDLFQSMLHRAFAGEL